MKTDDHRRIVEEAFQPIVEQLLTEFEWLVLQGIHPDEVWHWLIRVVDRRGHAKPRDVKSIQSNKKHRVNKARAKRSASRCPRNIKIQEAFYRQAIVGIPFKKIYSVLGKQHKLKRRQLQDICKQARAAARRVAGQ
jgi:hypothetical protein